LTAAPATATLLSIDRRQAYGANPIDMRAGEFKENRTMRAVAIFIVACLVNVICIPHRARAEEKETLYPDPINLNIPPISSDRSIKYDYDIVYVRAPRHGNDAKTLWAEIAHPWLLDPGADLMLLHPDGSEELLVRGGDGSIVDPVVSFDGQSVYYSHIHDLSKAGQADLCKAGADIYKLHLPTRKIVRLSEQIFTPNLGAAKGWTRDFRNEGKPGETYFGYGVYNMGPCPLPGGRLMFVSNRNGFRPPKHDGVTMQLFVMDEDGKNLEQIGYLNIGMALHPTVLMDGRVVFSSLESQGLRNSILWGLWSIHPDGTQWAPMISAFDTVTAPNAFHFQTQISDGSIIAEEYYNQNNSGFGAYFKLPPQPPSGYAGFGPAFVEDPRNPKYRFGRFDNSRPKIYRLPFSPTGSESFTRFANNGEGPADPSVRSDKNSPAVGKFTHPAAAPDDNLLTVWSPGPVNHQNFDRLPMPDGGIYLIKSGQPIDEPAQMRLIKNDPNYNEQWPRAVVPYRRIYGIDEPARLEPLANDGSHSPQLPAGSPFGLIGTSSLYKRESYPNGVVPSGKVTAEYAYPSSRDSTGYRGLDPFNTSENGATLNWFNQGSDAGLYSNDAIHAIRILVMEPTTDRHRGNYPRDGRLFYSHAQERLRILGEIPVRKFDANGKQPLDPDGNPDTSFLAKIPADTAFTFQTLDKDGMVLNMAQTWHQLRPGEIRNNCGGCHAHSQKPTRFEETAAARADYKVFDLTKQTPLLATRDKDESGRRWDADGTTGVRYVPSVKNVEYFHDIQPIFARSCAACHTRKAKEPAGKLVLDDDTPMRGPNVDQSVPGTYYRLALDEEAKFGYKPVIHNGQWRNQNASRYVRKFQSRRSLLVWKILGRRTDGWTNDDFPSETIPGDPNSLKLKGAPVANTQQNRDRADLDYNGHAMPPPEAVAGTYQGPNGQKIKVDPLSDEDRRTIIRWIDLGCPIDLDYNPAHPDERSYGWMCDDNRPTLTVTYPRPRANREFSRILIGMNDYSSGLDMSSFRVVADFAVDGVALGENLADRFRSTSQGIWELKLTKPIGKLPSGKLTVSVKDRQGNLSLIERSFSVP
jgi:hypothetical protein